MVIYIYIFVFMLISEDNHASTYIHSTGIYCICMYNLQGQHLVKFRKVVSQILTCYQSIYKLHICVYI